MAKSTIQGMGKAMRAVKTLGKQMHNEADADFAVSLSANAAGSSGLAKQTRGLTRDLLAGQLKSNASLSKLARNARAQTGVVASQQAKTTSRYGSALGESNAAAYAQAKATAGATGKLVTGAAKAGKQLTGVAQTVAGIAAQGVAAQRAAAEYSLNQALQQRNIIDNQTLAGLTGDLYKMGIEANLQWKMWKKQQEYALKQADIAAGKQTQAQLGVHAGRGLGRRVHPERDECHGRPKQRQRG